DVLTIGWKRNALGTQVMRYDATRNPAIQTATGIPIYTITATGRIGQARRTVVTEVIQKPYVVLARGAFTANSVSPDLGNAVICGNNHSADTPYDDGVKGWAAAPPFPDPDHCQDNELVGGSVPGVWCSQTVSPGGNAQEFGTPGILDS